MIVNSAVPHLFPFSSHVFPFFQVNVNPEFTLPDELDGVLLDDGLLVVVLLDDGLLVVVLLDDGLLVVELLDDGLLVVELLEDGLVVVVLLDDGLFVEELDGVCVVLLEEDVFVDEELFPVDELLLDELSEEVFSVDVPSADELSFEEALSDDESPEFSEFSSDESNELSDEVFSLLFPPTTKESPESEEYSPVPTSETTLLHEHPVHIITIARTTAEALKNSFFIPFSFIY